MSESDKGILYVAIGERMRQPLVRSIASVRKHLDLPITLVTDLAEPPVVDRVIEVEWPGRPGYAVKPAFVPRLPYERTLYLDTDTVVLHSDAAKPMELLTHRYGYHAAAVHGLSRRMHKVAPDLMCVPSFNSGVLFLRRSSIIQRAMRRWRNLYRGGEDEVALTKALLETKTPTYCLPCEWNYRGFGLNHWRAIRIVHHHSFLEPTDKWFEGFTKA